MFHSNLRLALEMLLALEMMIVPCLLPQFSHESLLAEAALGVELYLQVLRPIDGRSPGLNHFISMLERGSCVGKLNHAYIRIYIKDNLLDPYKMVPTISKPRVRR